MIRTYLDWLIAVPWSKRSEERLDPVHAREVLDADHAGLDDVKRAHHRVPGRAQAARRARRPRRPPLGRHPDADRPAGHRQDLDRRVDRARHRAGVRPHVARRRARRGRDPRPPAHLHRRAARPAGAGAARRRHDEPGDHARRGRQGRRRLARRSVRRPCSRCSTRRRTTPSATTTSTSSSTSRRSCSSPPPTWPTRFPARSSTAWRSSASTATPIEEKVAIARGFLWPRQVERNGLRPEEVERRRRRPADRDHRLHARGRRAPARARARHRAAQDGDARSPPERPRRRSPSTRPSSRDALGRPKFFQESAVRTAVPGVATGLAVTGTGGDVLFVEATSMPGTDGAASSPASSATS